MKKSNYKVVWMIEIMGDGSGAIGLDENGYPKVLPFTDPKALRFYSEAFALSFINLLNNRTRDRYIATDHVFDSPVYKQEAQC